MLTDDEIKAIEALGGTPELEFAVDRLLADRRELLALAKELAEEVYVAYAAGGWMDCDRDDLLAKARAAGLLEADRG